MKDINWKLAGKITAVYFLVSSLWIYFTDRLLRVILTTSDEIILFSTFKGVFFVITTSVLLFLLVLAFARKQCTRCRSLLETVNDAVIIYGDKNGEVLDMNRKARELFGHSGAVHALTARSLESAAYADDLSINIREWFLRHSGNTPQRFDQRFDSKDGPPLWTEITLQNVAINGRERKIAVVRDISARKRAEESLQEMNRTLKMLLKCNEVLIREENETELLENICGILVEEGGYRCAWVAFAHNDYKGRVTIVASSGLDPGPNQMPYLTEIDGDKGKGPTGTAVRTGRPSVVSDVMNDPRYASWRDLAIRTGYRSSLSAPLVHSGNVLGALTVCAFEADAFNDEEINLMSQLAGDLAYGIVSLRTAAEQKRIELELVASEKNLAEAQKIAQLGSWEYDLERDEELRSDEFFRILGVPPRKGGRADDSIFNYIHPDDRETVREKITETLEKGMPYDAEYRIIRPDGAVRVLHARGMTMEGATGKTARFIGTAMDITERKKTDDALRSSELRFRSLVEATTDWIWEIDKDNRYLYSSPKAMDLLGCKSEEIIGRTPFEVLSPGGGARHWEGKLRETLASQKPFSGLELESENGTRAITIETSGVPIYDDRGRFSGYRGISRDITGRKKLERQYLQAQKMEVVGQLAGGIAHDFNNILTAIIGFQHLLHDRLNDDGAKHFSRQVTMLAEKASFLTRDLLAFSRKQPMNPKPLDLNENIEKLGKLLERLIGEDVELRLNLQKGKLPLMAVSGHLEQVFMNLATNARDAMPGGGLLTIKTESVYIDEDFVRVYGYGAPGEYALVSVSDTGCGMDEETKMKVFEPFFTTKEVGKGTGLGLSTAYGIIRKHGGFLSVYSEPGEGSTFRIYLPLEDQEAGAEHALSAHVPPPRGTETILLVEDESEVREMTRTLLESNGFRVLATGDGEQAVEMFTENAGGVDLLLLDVIMPKKNGKEIYDEIREFRPDIKTIFISGYTADIVEQKGIPETCHLMSKPFSPHDFLWKIRNVLAEKDVSGFGKGL